MHISIYVIHALPFSLIKIVPSSPELTQVEKIMLDLPSSQNLRESLKLYTSEAHLTYQIQKILQLFKSSYNKDYTKKNVYNCSN